MGSEITSWTRLLALQFTLIPLEKDESIRSLLWLLVNSRSSWDFCLGEVNRLAERKLRIQHRYTPLKNDIVSHSAYGEGVE